MGRFQQDAVSGLPVRLSGQPFQGKLPIRKNYPGPIPSLVLVDANGNKIASGSMDGLVRKVEELASAEKEKEATTGSK